MNKIIAKQNGSVVEYGDGRKAECINEEVAEKLLKHVNKCNLYVIPYRGGNIDGWVNRPHRVMVRWNNKLQITEVGYCPDDNLACEYYDGKKKNDPLPQDPELDSPVKAVAKTGFLSELVHRQDPINGKYYWCAYRTIDGKPQEHNAYLRCKNKALAEKAVAADNKAGESVTHQQTRGDFWNEGTYCDGTKEGIVVVIKDGVVTQYDVYPSRQEADPYFTKLKRELGCATCVQAKDNLLDPDPEEIPKEKAQPGTWDEAMEEVREARAALEKGGEIPQPSTALRIGFQSGCNCTICEHIKNWQDQEAKKAEAAIQEAAKTIAAETIKTAKKPAKGKKASVLVTDELTADNVKQRIELAQQTVATPSQETSQTIKETHIMAPTNTIAQTLSVEAQEAGLRLAMKQLTKLVQEPLAAAIAAQLAPPGTDPNEMKARVGEFLKGEIGSVLVSTLLSLAISSVPANAIPGLTLERQANVSKELRVKAMSEAGDALLDVLMGPMRAALSGLVAGPAIESLTGVRAEDAGLSGEASVQEQVVNAAGASSAVKVNF